MNQNLLPLSPLAMLFSIQPMLVLAVRKHHWLMVSLLSTRTSQVCTCKVVFQLAGPQFVLVSGVIPPRGQEFLFPLLDFIKLLFAH